MIVHDRTRLTDTLLLKNHLLKGDGFFGRNSRLFCCLNDCGKGFWLVCGDVSENLAIKLDDMTLGQLRLTHEPEPLSPDDDRHGEVAGHLHPAVRVAAYGRGVRRPCFVTDGRRIVLPAFGAFTGGLNVRDPAVADLFATPPLAAALGRDRVHALAWSVLR